MVIRDQSLCLLKELSIIEKKILLIELLIEKNQLEVPLEDILLKLIKNQET